MAERASFNRIERSGDAPDSSATLFDEARQSAAGADQERARWERDSVSGGRGGFSADRERMSGSYMYGPSYQYDSVYIPPSSFNPYGDDYYYDDPGYYDYRPTQGYGGYVYGGSDGIIIDRSQWGGGRTYWGAPGGSYSRDSVYGGRDGYYADRYRGSGGYSSYPRDYGDYGYYGGGCGWGRGDYGCGNVYGPIVIPPSYYRPQPPAPPMPPFRPLPPLPPVPPVPPGYGRPYSGGGYYERDSVYGGYDGYSADRQRYYGGGYGGGWGYGHGGRGGMPTQFFDFALRGFDSWAGYDIARRHARGQYR